MPKFSRISVLALRRARNAFNEPLSPNYRKKIELLVENPTQATWTSAYTIILHGQRMTSLWQAVRAVDPTFSLRKQSDEPWPCIPDRDTILEAINLAVAGRVCS